MRAAYFLRCLLHATVLINNIINTEWTCVMSSMFSVHNYKCPLLGDLSRCHLWGQHIFFAASYMLWCSSTSLNTEWTCVMSSTSSVHKCPLLGDLSRRRLWGQPIFWSVGSRSSSTVGGSRSRSRAVLDGSCHSRRTCPHRMDLLGEGETQTPTQDLASKLS